MISQLTVFLENKEGRLASAVRSIARADINMQAMFLADTKDFGILRIFCDTPEKACRILQEEGYQARLIDVVAVKVPNVPGSLSKLFDYLDDKDINVEYAHCFMVGRSCDRYLEGGRSGARREACCRRIRSLQA